MKDFLKNYKLPLILGGCAVIAVVATLIVITGGFSSNSGLYITSAYGIVSVTNDDVSASSGSSDKAIGEGGIITVGEDSYCILAYKGSKNSEDNFLVMGANSQVLVSGGFDGKNDGELFLRRGTVIGNFIGDDKASVNVRTADAMITMDKSVVKVSYNTNEFMSYTDVYTVMGKNSIQLYDAAGSPVNDPEPQIAPRCGRIVSDEGPAFELLNNEFGLRELSAFDLKQLLTVAAIVGDGFTFNVEEMKAVYREKNGDEPADSTEPAPGGSEPSDVSTDPTDTSDIITTPSPNTETTLPGGSTIRVITRNPNSSTASVQQTTTVTTVSDSTDTDNTSDSSEYPNFSDPTGSRAVHTVIININGDEMLQEVAHGDNAVKPEDPVIDGLVFIGWDRSFENITEDTVITALFREDNGDIYGDPSDAMHKVTVIINGNTNIITVKHGQSANLPSNIDVEGYVFKGWDKDFSNITSDITITAILEPQNQPHIVTFVINGDNYTVQVEHGGTAVPPYIPQESTGFIGWDKSLNNITSDTTITAVYNITPSHTVTFMIDGKAYNVTVSDGGTAEPPFKPVSDANDRAFVGWDKDRTNIRSDTIITALFA